MTRTAEPMHEQTVDVSLTYARRHRIAYARYIDGVLVDEYRPNEENNR